MGTGAVVWLTGLSASGKSTIAAAVAAVLTRKNVPVVVLDGDVIRKTISRDLGYSKEDRDENVRRAGCVAELLSNQGIVVIVALISPYRAAREQIRAQVLNFIEVFVNAPLQVCEKRDPKGLYRLARSGQLPYFTGISDAYEPPGAPEVECRTDCEDMETSAERVLQAIEQRLWFEAETRF